MKKTRRRRSGGAAGRGQQGQEEEEGEEEDDDDGDDDDGGGDDDDDAAADDDAADDDDVDDDDAAMAAFIPRTRLPAPAPLNQSFSLWSVLRQAMGKDLNRISMPASINQPLSILQRAVEDFEYLQVRSIQTFFTHRSVSPFDRVGPFQLTGEHFLYGMALSRRDAVADRRARARAFSLRGARRIENCIGNGRLQAVTIAVTTVTTAKDAEQSEPGARRPERVVTSDRRR